MFDVFVLVLTLLPLGGLVMMEGGAFGRDLLEYGAPNGSAAAYSAHLLVLFGVYRLLRPSPTRASSAPVWAERSRALSRQAFRRLALSVLFLNLGLVGFMYFAAGASAVVAGDVEKGGFRTGLGQLGIVSYLARDFITPASCALVAFTFRRCGPRPYEAGLLVGNLLTAALNAAVWGYRAATVFMLVPAFLLLLPRVRVWVAVLLAAAAFATITVFGAFYGDQSIPESSALVIERATTGIADSAWKVWDLHAIGNRFPPYWPTLFSALGGRLSAAFGVPAGPNDMDRNYAPLLTSVVKNDAIVDGTSNVTATPFAEGVIALGSPGYLLFSVLAGAVLAAVRRVLDTAEERDDPLAATIAATYFGTSVVAWLNTGGITTLFLFPYLINYGLTAALVALLLDAAGMGRPDRSAAHDWSTPRRGATPIRHGHRVTGGAE